MDHTLPRLLEDHPLNHTDLYKMASQNQPPTPYGCDAVQPVDIVDEHPILQKLVVSQDPTPTEKLLISLQNIINQYSSRLNAATERDVSDNFDTLQDLCLSVERLHSSLETRKADVETKNRRYAACVAVLHDTIKSYRPAGDVRPITRNIADCSKEIQAHLSTLTYAFFDLKDHAEQMNSDLERLRSREQQACLHRNRNIELTGKVERLRLEAAELKGTNSDLHLQLQTSEHMRDKLEKQPAEFIEQLTKNQKTTDRRFEFLQNSIVDLDATIATKDLEIFQLKQLHNELSALAKQSTQERNRLRDQVTQDSSDADELRICNAELHHQLSRSSTAAESSRSQTDQLLIQLKQTKTALSELKAEGLELRKQKSDDAELSTMLSTRLEQTSKDGELLKARNTDLDARLQQTSKDRELLKARNTDLNTRLEQQTSKDGELLRARNTDLDIRLEQTFKDRELLKARNTDLNTRLEQTSKDRELLRARNTELDIRLQQTSKDRELLLARNTELEQTSKERELLRARNTDLDIRLEQTFKDRELLKARNTDLNTRLEQTSKERELLEARNTQLSINLRQSAHDAMQLSTRDDDLSIQRFQYSNEPNSPPPFPGHTTTPARRTSLAAFSPDNLVSNLVSKKRVIGKRASKGQGSRASIDSDSTQSRSPSESSLVSEPSLQRPMVVTTRASYPRDATTIGCVRIEAQDVEQGRWAPGVSGDLQELIKDYLKWAEGRKKSHLRPKVDQLKLSDIQCHWHELARDPRERVCEWERNADGGKDCYHACLCCESRGQLCCILESQNILVLLPLLPSSRHDKRHDLGPGHLSYWVNVVH